MRTIRRRPDSPDADGSPRLTRGNIVTLAAFFLTLAVIVAGSVIHLPYAVMSPGPTFDTLGRAPGTTQPVIEIDDARTYPTEGMLRFTTVAFAGGPGFPVDVWTVLGAWFDPARDILPVEEVFPPELTQQQLEQGNTVLMKGSQQEATAVALRAVGHEVPTHMVVAEVLPTSKVGDQLRPGDRFVSVAGRPVASMDAIRAALQQVEPGAPVELAVTREGKLVTVTVPTITGSEGRTALGVLLGLDHDFPFPVEIRAGDVGGSSAGLMFALAIYDKLTPGALTGAEQIAGTGTIDESGAVGPIGGIRQKIIGSRDDGASWFLAPAANCPEVGAVPDGITVVKVSSFDGAKAAVESIAAGSAEGLPHC